MTDLLMKLAPTAATLLTGPLGGMAVEALGKALGLSDATQEAVKSVLAGPLNPEQIVAIKKAEQDLKIRLKELDIKLEEIHSQDRQSARTMQVNTRSLIPAILSIITVGGFFTLLIGAAIGEFELTGSDVMMLLLGVLARETASVYQFWLGSSSGSQQKTDIIGRK